MRYGSLSKNPSHFQHVTGLTPAEFQELLINFRPQWQSQRLERLDRPNRIRKIGGGPMHKLELEDRLLVYTVYAKLYLPYLLMEFLFGVDESTICRIIQEISQVLGDKIIINRRPGKRIRTIEELRELIPDLDEIITDATEQEVPRPEKKKERKKYHSGKNKSFTIKTQISVTPNRLIVNVSPSIPGRTHDYKYFQKTEVPGWLERNPQVIGRFDLGYLGVKRDYPKASIIHGIKRNRWKRKLTRSEKIFNTKCSKKRIVAEHAIANLKKYRILGDIYRNNKERYSMIFASVASLVNFRMLSRQTS